MPQLWKIAAWLCGLQLHRIICRQGEPLSFQRDTAGNLDALHEGEYFRYRVAELFQFTKKSENSLKTPNSLKAVIG
jgi:hypothetical protein